MIVINSVALWRLLRACPEENALKQEHWGGCPLTLPSIRGRNNVVYETPLRRSQWVGEKLRVLQRVLIHVLPLEDDLHCAFGPHDGDLRGGPSVVHVRAQVLACHDVVRPPVRLPCDNRDLGHGRLGVRK